MGGTMGASYKACKEARCWFLAVSPAGAQSAMGRFQGLRREAHALVLCDFPRPDRSGWQMPAQSDIVAVLMLAEGLCASKVLRAYRQLAVLLADFD